MKKITFASVTLVTLLLWKKFVSSASVEMSVVEPFKVIWKNLIYSMGLQILVS